MKKYSVSITSSIISILFILLTGWISYSHTHSVLFEFTFIFHMIPFGIGFAGGTSILIYVYYFFLWIGLALLFSPIVLAFFSSKNKKKFLTISIAPLILAAIITLYIDYSKNKKRAENIAQRLNYEQIEFGHLRTGDLVFNRISGDSQTGLVNDSHSSYNNIGVVFINDGNYVVIETTDRVKYTSLSQWIDKGYDHQYVVKRLIKADSLLTSETTQKLRKEVQSNIFKETEKALNWSDDKMYNPELVWKIYKKSLNVELGALDTVRVDSTSEYVITSNSIFNSKNLFTVRKK